jgi:hypothetical protein
MTTPDLPQDPAPPPDPEPDAVPTVLAGQEEYLRAEVGRHR